MTHKQYFMIANAFGNFDCLLCYQTFKSIRSYVLKKHFDCFHSEMHKFNNTEREDLYNKYKTLYLEKIKGWMFEVENYEPKTYDKKFKNEISSLVSLDIIRHGRPFSDGKFIKEMLIKILQKFNLNFSGMQTIPLSRSSVSRRSISLGASVECAIKEKLKNCEFFSIALDESTDINDLSQLVVCIRCVDANYDVFETMFTLETFYGSVTGKLLFDVVSDKLFSVADPRKFAGVCTDGANVMTGRHEGFVGQIKKHGFDVKNFHCIIHQTALASKFMSECPAMKTAEKVINKIRGGHHSLTHRKFVKYLKTKNASSQDLIMFTEVRWLSRGSCLNRLFDLREEVAEFLELEDMEEFHSFKDLQFILDLAFLADTTAYLNDFICALQGKDQSFYDLFQILLTFKAKLFLLLSEIQSKVFSNFPKTSIILQNTNNITKYEHLVFLFETLFNNFQDRFEDFESMQTHLDLFQSPFTCNIMNYDFKIQSELIILRSEVKAPEKNEIVEFWKKLDMDFPELKKKSLKFLSYFPSTYTCEQIFSDMKYICSKQRNRMHPAQLKNILLIRNCHKSINLESFI